MIHTEKCKRINKFMSYYCVCDLITKMDINPVIVDADGLIGADPGDEMPCPVCGLVPISEGFVCE